MKMQVLWLFFALLIVVNCDDNDTDDHVDDGDSNNEVSTDLPSIYYTEPSSFGDNDAKGFTEIPGGHILRNKRVLEKSKSPYLLREDLFIEREGKLVVESGVEIRFAPMIGITVRGILTAKGEPEAPIILTSSKEPSSPSQSETRLIRLVDGPSTLEGRLQIFHRGSWRSVCTNSRNWTRATYETACRELGYQGGRWSGWIDKLWPSKPRLLYEDPQCHGTESSLQDCLQWSNRQLGSGVCDYHPDISISCTPKHDGSSKNTKNWRGIKFENALYEKPLIQENTFYIKRSKSIMRHVTLKYAGSGREYNVTSALHVEGVPPQIDSLIILNSAYNGINITTPDSPIIINNCTIKNNNGYGIFMNSSTGLAHINNCEIINNYGDGIKYIHYDERPDDKLDRNNIYDLCTFPSTTSQTFPITISMEQSKYSQDNKTCSQRIFTRYGHVLTLQFLQMKTDRNDSGSIMIYDGLSEHDKLIANVNIRNNTLPQSITTTKRELYIQFVAQSKTKIINFIRISSGYKKKYDINITNSIIEGNNGRGIGVENLRSLLHVHGTSVSANNHIAGIHVLNGAADINITSSRISYNNAAGINITMTGGNRNISKSIISSNQGYGLSLWLNDSLSTEYLPFNQSTVVEYSNIFNNNDVGVLIGNSTGLSYVNITGNNFYDCRDIAIKIQTSWINDNKTTLKLQIGNNIFTNNSKVAIDISPALNIIGKIEYNQFRKHQFGVIHIKNSLLYEEFNVLPANILIQYNDFFINSGIYVVSLGLSTYSDLQYLLFTRNFIKDNNISEPFDLYNYHKKLIPRSRVSAVIVVSSSNVVIFRNIISNPDSNYEIGSHLEDQSKIINCTLNWLGSSDENKILDKLFYRKDRYNLAKIDYLPYLLHDNNPASNIKRDDQYYVQQFIKPGTNLIGGEIDGQLTLYNGEYIVERDINIRPGGKLILEAGVTLKFPPAVGMMVAGTLTAHGTDTNQILLTLKEETKIKTIKNNSTKNIFDNNTNNVPIRLLGGNKTNYEGRLQVKIGEKWGTVCNYGWTINNAALVCHQLGLVLDPDDWNFERSDIPDAGKNEDIIISNVRCTDNDIDITKCKLEFFDEFENSCSHDNDVGVRCLEAAWAGLRLGPLATRTDLKYITIEKSGLLDYTTNAFKPALQIDFSRHSLEYLNIINNLQDGIGIIYSDIYSGDAINTIDNCDLSYNRGSGISFKQLGLKILNSKIENNKVSGIRHNPALSAVKQREFAGWFMQSTSASVDVTYKPTIIPDDFINNNLNNIIKLDSSSIVYIVTSKINKNIKINIEIECSPERIIGIQLLNPIENRSTESIIIHDSKRLNSNGNIWNLKRDLSVFPVASSSYTLIIEYESGDNAIGGAVLVLTTIEAIQQNIKNRIKQGPIPTLTLVNTIIKRNKNGMYASYYNRYFDEIGNHFLRKSNESIRFINCDISNNENEAIKILSPYWNIYQSNISEISIHINNTLITDNGRGIYQFSHDMRQSNNLFHWIIQDSTIERNKDGGFNVALPYVWQYNENFTHSLYFDNNTWRDNYNFGIIIDGHYATLNMSNNKFNDNKCKHGLISIRGMEKKMKIHNNHIENNNGTFMIEFKIDSQSEIIGEIPAIFNFNYVSKNYDGLIANKYHQNDNNNNHHQMFNIQTCVVCFRGIQKVIIKRNIFGDNLLNYELLAGIKTAKINNNVNVEENWWGTSNDNEIKKRIFDFDDWNNHAIANYRPYLSNNEFTSDLITSTWDITTSIDMENLGGRIINNLLIQYRDKPYIINSDITIMPEATVIIEPGVKMEFASNVGILVLGTLKAIGERDNEIIMRPIIKSKNSNEDDNNDVIKSSSSFNTNNDVPTIRLCKEGKCNSTTNEGFIEYFNKTTLQWIPICDSRFSERNAQVACRQLGYNSLNVFVSYDKRYELHPGSLTRIWSWPEPLQCSGNEESLENCQIRLNGQLYGKKLNCPWDGKWVFINCGDDYNKNNNNHNTHDYWGGIRIANSEFEHHFYEHRMHDLITHETIRRVESILKYINIEGAGILHNEKSPAIQTVMKNPEILFVSINNSAYHGINIISPTHTLQLRFNKINNAHGNGINLLALTGEGREADESSFSPLKNINIPYNLFSMVDICDTSKEIEIEERILLYYKYDNNPVNCIKIFRSTYRAKPIGFRLLQFNIFNSTGKPGRADEITLYDGDIYNVTAKKIGQLEFNSKDEKKLFKTDGPSLSVKLFANGASGIYGFIAEIVTLPISAIGFNRDVQHNISNSIISNCQDGAIKYSNAGEVNAIVTIEKNQIIHNCKKFYGNFSTCKETISMNIQNTQSLYFRNNLIRYNQGGLSIISDSRGSATSLKGWIYNNLFSDNYNAPVLSIEGRKSSPYQEVTIFRNYFMKNNAPYDNNIILKQVVSNMTLNYLRANLGLHLLEVSGFERVRLPIYQTTSHNGFYNNYAVDPLGRSTIVAGTPGQQYVDNIFFNPDNDYEIMTVNRSLVVNKELYDNHLEMWRSHVDAKHNWWSYNETLAVAGRIRDREDSLELLQVDYIPYHMNNKTVLNNKCPPGWDLVGDTCYIYIGAPMDFFSARKFCQEANASMPFIVPSTVPFTTGKYSALWEFLLKQQERFSYSDLVWIQDLDKIDQCTTFTYQHIEIDNCDRPSPFICEIDPGIRINPLSWKADVVALGVFSACTIAIALLAVAICFWISKSKRRKVERLERRNSIRQSLHSLRSIGSTTGFTELSYRRKPLAPKKEKRVILVPPKQTKSTDTLASRSMDYKKMMNNGSIDSMDKSQLNSSIEDNRSYDVYESHNPQYSPSTSDFKTATSSSSSATKQTNQKYQVPHADNPVFDLAYRNEGFRNHSTFTSRNNSNWASMANSEVAQDDTPTDQINESTYLNTNASTLPLNSSIAMTDSISELKRDIDNAPYSYEQYGPPPITPGSEPVPEYFIPPSPPQPYYYEERPRSGTLLETNLDCNEDKPLRSKSEALLETNFDVYFPNEPTELTQLSANSRSKSQPLETAM